MSLLISVENAKQIRKMMLLALKDSAKPMLTGNDLKSFMNGLIIGLSAVKSKTREGSKSAIDLRQGLVSHALNKITGKNLSDECQDEGISLVMDSVEMLETHCVLMEELHNAIDKEKENNYAYKGWVVVPDVVIQGCPDLWNLLAMLDTLN